MSKQACTPVGLWAVELRTLVSEVEDSGESSSAGLVSCGTLVTGVEGVHLLWPSPAHTSVTQFCSLGSNAWLG